MFWGWMNSGSSDSPVIAGDGKGREDDHVFLFLRMEAACDGGGGGTGGGTR